jgi:hypothetical protein
MLPSQDNRKEDDGMYKCTITNKFGSISHTIQVGTENRDSLVYMDFCALSVCRIYLYDRLNKIKFMETLGYLSKICEKCTSKIRVASLSEIRE